MGPTEGTTTIQWILHTDALGSHSNRNNRYEGRPSDSVCAADARRRSRRTDGVDLYEDGEKVNDEEENQ